MLKRYSIVWSRLFLLCDWFLITCSMWMSIAAIANGWQNHTPSANQNMFSAILVLLLWMFFARIYDLYASKRFLSFYEDTKATTATIVSTITVYTLLELLTDAIYHIDFALSFFFSFLIITTFHYIIRLFLRFIRAGGRNQRKVIIYGAGQLGQLVAINITRRPWTGLKIVGFLDDDPAKHGQEVVGYPILGPAAMGAEIIQKRSIDEVIITLPAAAYPSLTNFILGIQRFPINIRVVPDLLQVVAVKARIEDLWGIPVIGIRQPVIDGFDAFIKRFVDLSGAAIGLLLMGPAMAVIALLIKLDSPGPVFFIQERVGQNGKTFRMFKFRTMVSNAERLLDRLIDVDNLDQPMFKIKNDPRVTRVGRWLRRTSLDELPQLFNVLRGEMSLVGPRPEEKRIVEQYSYWHRQRLAAKPGITGPMQIGGRGDLSMDERVSLEVDYIENYSLLLDFEIILRTVPAVLFARGAY